MQKKKVLFLCTGNSARSQMAEAFVREYAGDHIEPYSAGLEPAGLNPFTVRVMEEAGFDLSDHRSKDCVEYMGRMHFGYLVTVCAHAEKHCPSTFPGVSERLHWPFEDPAAFEGPEEATLEKFREVRDQIDEAIRAWLADLGHPVQGEK
jgi:arsenate reductase